MRKLQRLLWTVLLALVIPLGLAGCSDSDDGDDNGDSGGSDNSKFVGTWALSQGGGTLWYIIFNSDNSWLISDTADGSARRVYGTYTVDDPRGYLPIETPALLPRPDGQRGLDRVELADDAATWARQAHTILRTGYLVPVIVHDDGSPAGQDR